MNYEANGYLRILLIVKGSLEKYGQRKISIEGALQADGSLERDTTTGHPTIGFEGEIEVKGRRPAGTNFTAALSSWTLGYSDADIFRFRLEIPSTEAITEDELDTYTPIRAMLAWLESNRTAGTEDRHRRFRSRDNPRRRSSVYI